MTPPFDPTPAGRYSPRMPSQNGVHHSTDDPFDSEGPEGPHAAARTLMSGLVDYAGLFPPAKLDMRKTVENYALYAKSDSAWMLGRLIVPVSRLSEFAQTLEEVDGLAPEDMIPVSVISTDNADLERDLDAVHAFNHDHIAPRKRPHGPRGSAGGADAFVPPVLIDAIEIKLPVSFTGSGTGDAVEFINSALESMPDELYPFFELPIMPPPGHAVGAPAPDVRGLIASLSGADAAAKVRTGGVTQDAFPAANQIAGFLIACAQADVPFKATAGLHHAIRAHYPLTYEPNCDRGVMHGFLNLFLAATLVRTHRPHLKKDVVTEMLEETDPEAFKFGDTLVNWRSYGITLEQIAHTRETFALSFGSCSFEEPVTEVRRIAGDI